MTYQNHTNYNCEITLDDGETFKVFSQWLSNQKLYQWKNWNCDAGFRRLYIDVQEEVYGGVCRNEHLGNLKSGWALLNDKTVCQQDHCTVNTDDLVIFKQQDNKE